MDPSCSCSRRGKVPKTAWHVGSTGWQHLLTAERTSRPPQQPIVNATTVEGMAARQAPTLFSCLEVSKADAARNLRGFPANDTRAARGHVTLKDLDVYPSIRRRILYSSEAATKASSDNTASAAETTDSAKPVSATESNAASNGGATNAGGGAGGGARNTNATNTINATNATNAGPAANMEVQATKSQVLHPEAVAATEPSKEQHREHWNQEQRQPKPKDPRRAQAEVVLSDPRRLHPAFQVPGDGPCTSLPSLRRHGST
mmetsp:Transcript_14408/g.36333  ORF Transcript_14408/g.36333 Transcript_14408/m.36333 type:complete len:260 (-) Transcript_14408:1209-1988(-)